jgi:predicted nucleic acid-binding protein
MTSVYDSERLAAGYAFDRPPIHEQILRSAHLARQADQALDVGCGAGLSTAALAPLARQVIGLEPIPTMLTKPALAAPHLMPVEAANILRRAALAGDISADVASLAHTDLLDLRVEFFPYQPCAARVWELRENVTCYDGWYVAVAELLDAPPATLDSRLANSPGPRCQFMLPPAAT